MARTKCVNDEPVAQDVSKKRSSAQVRIEEPDTTQPRPVRTKMMARRTMATEKGKAKESPMDKRLSDSETDSDTELIHRVVAESRRKAQQLEQKQKGTGKSSSSVPSSFPESQLSFLDNDLDEGVNKAKLSKHYKEKQCCAVVWVDLETMKRDPDLKIDLSAELGRYSRWLKVNESFSLEVVRRFYCNMKLQTGYKDPEFLVPGQDILITSLRGRVMRISAALINEVLGTPVPTEPPPPLSVIEAQELLLQRSIVGPALKSIRPASMCVRYRLIHYIYSRCLLTKISSFTYISQEDCLTLARIVRGDHIDIGEFIFGQMKQFVDGRYQSAAQMPYPQIVSLILKRFNVAHLQGEAKSQIAPFDIIQIKRMGIEVPYDHARDTRPPPEEKKKKEKVLQEEPQEAPQSAPPPPRITDELVTQIEAMIRSAVQDSQKVLLERLDRLQHEVDDIKVLMVDYIHKIHRTSFTEDELRGTEQHEPEPIPVPEPSSPMPPPEPAPEPPQQPGSETPIVDMASSP